MRRWGGGGGGGGEERFIQRFQQKSEVVHTYMFFYLECYTINSVSTNSK